MHEAFRKFKAKKKKLRYDAIAYLHHRTEKVMRSLCKEFGEVVPKKKKFNSLKD